jgi:hypothetical protein
MKNITKELKEIKEKGNNIIPTEVEDFVYIVHIQKEYEEYYVNGELFFVDSSICEEENGAHAISPDLVINADHKIFTYKLCKDCKEMEEK